jgi:hypothetical protein
MQRLQGRPGAIDLPDQDQQQQRSRILKAGNIEARFDFDASLSDTLARIQYTLEDKRDDKVADLGVLEDMDTVVLGFGAFSGHWTTAQFMAQTKAVLDGLMEVRQSRQLKAVGDKNNKMNNLRVIWMGAPAWTDDSNQHWRTNQRTLYWNKLVDGMIDTINVQVGGMIDRLLGFEITVPFKNSTRDHVHYTSEVPVDGFSAELIHKLDLCS